MIVDWVLVLFELEGNLYKLHCFVFLAMFAFVTVAWTQSQSNEFSRFQSQETVNAIISGRVESNDRDIAQLQKDLYSLTSELSSLRSSLDRFTGIGIGMGAALTALQGILIIITVRKKNGS